MLTGFELNLQKEKLQERTKKSSGGNAEHTRIFRSPDANFPSAREIPLLSPWAHFALPLFPIPRLYLPFFTTPLRSFSSSHAPPFQEGICIPTHPRLCTQRFLSPVMPALWGAKKLQKRRRMTRYGKMSLGRGIFVMHQLLVALSRCFER